MPAITAHVPVRLRMRINYRGRGYNELYWMQGLQPAPGPGFMTLVANCLKLCQYRATWFGWNTYIEYASLSNADRGKDGYMIPIAGYQAFPAPNPTPLASDTYVNDVVDAVEYRFEAGVTPPAPATWGERLFRGVPDDWITDQAWAAPFPPLTPLPAGPIAALTYQTPFVNGAQQFMSPASVSNIVQIQRSFLNLLMSNCGFLYKGTTPLDRTTWTVTPYTRIVYRDISSHRTGGAFGQFRGRAKKSY